MPLPPVDDDITNIFLHSRSWEPQSTTEPIINFDNVNETLLPAVDVDKQLQNIMDCIIPPTVKEVALEEKLEVEMRERRGKEFGICPIRRELYDDLFDELIRQVTVNCAERGLLLLRVRDEIRMTLHAYQSVLESSIAYGLRKAIIVEQEQSHAVIERDEERTKNAVLVAKISQLEKQIENDKMLNEDELETLEQRMKEENERLLESNKVLKNQVQAILQMDKMSGLDIAQEEDKKDEKKKAK